METIANIFDAVWSFIQYVGELLSNLHVLADIKTYLSSFIGDISYLMGCLPPWISVFITLIVGWMIVIAIVKALGWVLDAIPVL